MEPSIHSYSLCTALSLMSLFGFHFLLAPTPEKTIFNNYLRSRRTMGVAVLPLAANYSVHFFFGIRFKNTDVVTLMNLPTCFSCYWLFSSVLTTLLDHFYIIKCRLRTHICLWILFPIPSGIVLLLLSKGGLQVTVMFALAVWLVIYELFLTRRLLRVYHRATRIFDDARAGDIGAYIKWPSVFTYWAVTFGVGCGLLTFLPDRYIYIWILSSVSFYIYLFLCYLGYLLFYGQVENVMEDGMTLEEEDPCDTASREQARRQDTPFLHVGMAKKIKGWVDADGYIQPGPTIKGLPDVLHTNRTYFSVHIKTMYKMTFREWITGLRLEYAKNILKEYPEINIQKLAESSGFLSRSNFIKSFTEKEGCTPGKQKKANPE